MSELDPVAIRKTLTAHRNAGLQFDEAWTYATTTCQPSRDERSVYEFVKRHFRAAYYDNDLPDGRCMVPERDTSSAVVAKSDPEPVAREYDHCRSGDRCDRPATRGRFGKAFCDHHADELERISRLHFSGGGFGQGRAVGTAA